MPEAVDLPLFIVGALLSLSTSWVLVSRLERLGERFGFSEALLGIVAALAADAPEITSAVTALLYHEPRVGAGVVIGSNVFNLAALLGLGAVVAGRIALHRRVVLLGGTAAMWVAGACLAAVLGLLSPLAALVVALLAVVPYVVILGTNSQSLGRLSLPPRWVAWMAVAVAEEESELRDAIRPRSGKPLDASVAGVSLVVVVAASVLMERTASALDEAHAVPEIVTGGLVRAGATSLPSAVAAVYLAARGRGAAVLSTALNSNTLNVVAGLLLPAAVLGLGRPSGAGALVAAWYVGLTALTLTFAYRDRGLGRGVGLLIVGAYIVFLCSLIATA